MRRHHNYHIMCAGQPTLVTAPGSFRLEGNSAVKVHRDASNSLSGFEIHPRGINGTADAGTVA
jgi:hypothetical protein